MEALKEYMRSLYDSLGWEYQAWFALTEEEKWKRLGEDLANKIEGG